MKTWRVYTNDGNQMLFDGPDIITVCEYMITTKNYHPADIYKVEEVTE